MAADVTSLRNLRTGYIDLYQPTTCRRRTLRRYSLPGGAYEALTAARRPGRSAIGVTAPQR